MISIENITCFYKIRHFKYTYRINLYDKWEFSGAEPRNVSMC